MSVKIFFCYAHEDEPLLKKLKVQLTPMQRQGLIEVWHDRDISAGTEWEQEISIHLNDAEIILLLVSPDFMASDYCYSIEMKRAIERHTRKEALVIPVILRPVHWQDILGNIEALPTDAKPVMSSNWHSPDYAFFDVAEAILKALTKFRALDHIQKFKYAEASPNPPNQSLSTQKPTPTNTREDDFTILQERVLSQTKGTPYYCIKCKVRREMKDPEVIIMKNGKPAMKGHCAVCGTTINAIVTVK
jgi:hypothetical protein